MSFLSSKTQWSTVLCHLSILKFTLFKELEPKLYSITILWTTLYGEIIRGVDYVYYNRN